ncbi:jg16696 [Pararge aegeria aegeria]|uniref:Jg16696 protein n=1 Tax=Pararge aegeria aegeria TaxID=348720 RepID=A0A8S4RK41_9NEOP|nr:jg16696 [Pararge aegeria aegeria]
MATARPVHDISTLISGCLNLTPAGEIKTGPRSGRSRLDPCDRHWLPSGLTSRNPWSGKRAVMLLNVIAALGQRGGLRP